MSNNTSPRVGLFATCLVDLMRPVVGFAAVKLLEDAGCIGRSVPEAQTCCGQPAYNAGDTPDTIDIARQGAIATFEAYRLYRGRAVRVMRRHANAPLSGAV